MNIRALFLFEFLLRLPSAPILVLVFTSFVAAEPVNIDHDTTIDATSPLSGSHIEVVDGLEHHTTVSIISGGTVAGFSGRENSRITLDGGVVSFLSSIQDNATFVMKSGTVGCTEQVCQVIDYDALFTADSSSKLYIYGGTVGSIRLNDSSVAHVYGQNLSFLIFDPSGVYVEGTYASGDPVNLSFSFRPDSGPRVILHNVPEPGVAMEIIAFACCLLYWGRRSRSYS